MKCRLNFKIDEINRREDQKTKKKKVCCVSFNDVSIDFIRMESCTQVPFSSSLLPFVLSLLLSLASLTN